MQRRGDCSQGANFVDAPLWVSVVHVWDVTNDFCLLSISLRSKFGAGRKKCCQLRDDQRRVANYVSVIQVPEIRQTSAFLQGVSGVARSCEGLWVGKEEGFVVGALCFLIPYLPCMTSRVMNRSVTV